jgi:hypothetical protein
VRRDHQSCLTTKAAPGSCGLIQPNSFNFRRVKNPPYSPMNTNEPSSRHRETDDMNNATGMSGLAILFWAATAASGVAADPLSASVQKRADDFLKKMTPGERLGSSGLVLAFAPSSSLEKRKFVF